MFSRGHGKSHGSKPKKEANTKKHHIRNWMHSRKKKKHESNLFASTRVTTTGGVIGKKMRIKNPLPQRGSYDVMMSSGDTPPPAQASISSTAFDTVDDARLEKNDSEKAAVAIPLTSMKPAKSAQVLASDPEAIEEAVPIVRETRVEVGSEAKPRMENGIDGIVEDKEEPPAEEYEDQCLINCIYYAQECCICTIS